MSKREIKNILITGSAGYLGGICAKKMLELNYNVTGFDNLSTGHSITIDKLKKYENFNFIKGDLKNYDDINSALNNIDAVMHFAGYSQVDESQINPVKYYENNVSGSINLFKAMINNKIEYIVFSSSALIYGNPLKTPIKEEHPKNPVNVYGGTKLTIENMLSDLYMTNNIKSAKLRCFNAIGASNDLEFGEFHNPETHLIPNILSQNNFKVYGNDYNTKDGTCIRDYVDVEDLTDAHILALKYIHNTNKCTDLNIGSQKGYSVLDIIKYCNEATNKEIKFETVKRRTGDPSILIADISKAKQILNWSPKIDILQSIKKAYEFQINSKDI